VGSWDTRRLNQLFRKQQIMLIFFKNFKRTERTLLSIQSIRYWFPTIKIYCLNLYLNSSDEYIAYSDLFKELDVVVFYDKKTYNFESDAGGSINNGFYFTEGLNKMFNLCNDDDDKVLMLDEDSFFTSGETLKFLIENEFDLAYGTWPSPNPNKYEQINGSIICLKPRVMKNIFPIKECGEYIENLLGRELYDKCIKMGLRVIKIPTRTYTDYGGDGIHTNDVEIIKKELIKVNIPFKL